VDKLGEAAVITWLGQAQQSPEDAAGQAAYEEAQHAEWPPTRENAQAVGGAAGTAACHAAAEVTYGATEAAAQLGWCQAVGEWVGGIFYDLADSFFGSNEATRKNLDRINRDVAVGVQTLKAGYRLCELRVKQGGAGPKCGTYDEKVLHDCVYNRVIGGSYSCGSFAAQQEAAALHSKYHLPQGKGYTWGIETDEQLQAQLKRIAAAESGRGAEIIARYPSQPKKSSALPVFIGVAIAAGVAWLLLA